MVCHGAVGGASVVWVTVGQAAVKVQRDERTVQRWIAQGRLAAVDDGTGRRLVRLDEALRLEADLRMRVKNKQQQRMVELLGDWQS